MRRWMTIVIVAVLAMAAVAGWGIGQLAGGGSGESITPGLVAPTNDSTTAAIEPDPATVPPAEPAALPASPTTPGTPVASEATVALAALQTAELPAAD